MEMVGRGLDVVRSSFCLCCSVERMLTIGIVEPPKAAASQYGGVSRKKVQKGHAECQVSNRPGCAPTVQFHTTVAFSVRADDIYIYIYVS